MGVSPKTLYRWRRIEGASIPAGATMVELPPLALGAWVAEVVAAIERQVRNAQAFCRRAADAQFFQPGCPIQYNRPLPPAPK
jgi:hypothetical protein